MRKAFTLVLVATLFMSFGYCQKTNIEFDKFGKIYEVKKIKNWRKFEELTPFEDSWHRMIQESNDRIDHRYKVDSLYLPSISPELKKSYYEQELKLRVNFKENRSRYFINHIKNGKAMEPISFSPERVILSTECVCILRNDTIDVSMGIWAFGGFFFEIKIVDKKYFARYLEDAHEEQPFKYSFKDTSFVNQLVLQIKDSELIIDDAIEFNLHEVINGQFEFETPLYYADSYYHFEYPHKEGLDEIKTKGKIYFTCKLREPIEPLKE